MNICQQGTRPRVSLMPRTRHLEIIEDLRAFNILASIVIPQSRKARISAGKYRSKGAVHNVDYLRQLRTCAYSLYSSLAGPKAGNADVYYSHLSRILPVRKQSDQPTDHQGAQTAGGINSSMYEWVLPSATKRRFLIIKEWHSLTCKDNTHLILRTSLPIEDKKFRTFPLQVKHVTRNNQVEETISLCREAISP